MAEGTPANAQGQNQGRQVRLRVNEAHLTTSYVNAFRTQTSAEEFILDMGMNTAVPQGAVGTGGEVREGELIFDARLRAVMNYYTAKRLAMMLGQAVRNHEEQFGEIKLNVADRTRK